VHLWTPPRPRLWAPPRRPVRPARCAVGVNNVGGTFYGFVGVNTDRTQAFTVGNGAERLLLAIIAGYYDNSPPANATYAGVAMTPGLLAARSANNDFVQFWYLVAPTSGANNFVIQQPDNSIVLAALIDLTGVDQASPLRATSAANEANGTGTSASLSLTSAAGEYVVGGIGKGSNTAPTVGADQVSISSGSGGGESARASYEPGAASTTHSYTWTGSASYTVAALVVQASGGAAAGQYMTAMRGMW
jgi:hypothetical protein